MTSLRDAIHVYPVHDLVRHEVDGAPCPCGPRTECEGRVLIHHAWDERERYEEHVDALHELCRGVVH